MANNIDLISSMSRVETPFIIAKIGGYSFGLYNKITNKLLDASGSYTGILTDYPNYMQSINVTKINGQVNTYTLVMVYAIRANDDPNLLERIFSKAKQDRKITLSYGDYSNPSFIYKEEECIITNITSNFNINNSSITYTISAVSQCLGLSSGTYNFPAVTAKPSDIIKEKLYNITYGILDVFPGMVDKEKVLSKGLIAGDDRIVRIEAKTNITIFNYLKYLVSCMSYVQDVDSSVSRSNKYSFIIYDDIKSEWGGAYFKVVRTPKIFSDYNSQDIYEIDVGYQGQNIVTAFSINDSQTYSILYDYAGKIQQSEYIYRINDNGDIETAYSPNVTNQATLNKTTEADKTWWANMTEYPINVTLTLKGLLRPAILMTYIKLNVLFYGRKHISSGMYVVTKQVDQVDASGFRTTLNLLRVGGDT